MQDPSFPNAEVLAGIMDTVGQAVLDLPLCLDREGNLPLDANHWTALAISLAGNPTLEVILAAELVGLEKLGADIFASEIAPASSPASDVLSELLNVVAGQIKSYTGRNYTMGLPRKFPTEACGSELCAIFLRGVHRDLKLRVSLMEVQYEAL